MMVLFHFLCSIFLPRCVMFQISLNSECSWKFPYKTSAMLVRKSLHDHYALTQSNWCLRGQRGTYSNANP